VVNTVRMSNVLAMLSLLNSVVQEKMLIVIMLGLMEDVRDSQVSEEKATGLTFVTMVSIMNVQEEL